MLVISQVKTDHEIHAVRELIREYTTWAFSLQEDAQAAPTFQKLEEELLTLPGIFAPPTGRLLLASQDDQPAGCVALIGHDARICELKRLYVRPIFRGYSIGTALVNTLKDNALQAGYEQMTLSSHISMKQAHNLYKAMGFKEVAAPDDFPDDHKSHVKFMTCELIIKT